MGKKCTKCRIIKDLSDFGKDRSKSDGLMSSCKVCNRERSKKYYGDNKIIIAVRRRKKTS